MVKAMRIKIFGRVQGVFFRHSAKQLANKLNIKGFAKNKSDGSVLIEAVGEEKHLKTFINWCKKGLELAYVEKIEVVELPKRVYLNFSIK